MKNVAAYIRVSTDGQCKEDRFGLEVQRESIINYCKENDLKIIRWFKDEGESGAKERPGFDEIIYGDVNNPPFEAVIVAKSDRVARDINIYYYYKMMLRKKDIELISIAEDFGQFGAFAPMFEAFTLCVAEMERENINKRTSGGRKVKAAKGGYAGGKPPYGYNANHGVLIINDAEADVIRESFAMREKGFILQDICDTLTNEGKLSRKGNPFTPCTINYIFKNRPLYEGMYRYGKDAEWIKGEHEPIL